VEVVRYSTTGMRRVVLAIATAVVGGAFLLGYGLSRGDRATAPMRVATVVDQVREALEARYYRPVPPRVLRLGSVEAMLSALGDPYTEYLPHADYELLEQELAGSYVGIGISVAPGRSGLLVVATRPGPARAAGIRAGDTIVRIGSEPALRLGLTQALTRIGGPSGTRVRLELMRAGQVRWVSVPRRQMLAQNVQGRLVAFAGRSWADVKISAFAKGTAAALRRTVERLQRLGAAGFVLDLRDDPGGLLTEAVSVASLFLRRGVVVTLRGAHEVRTVYRARGDVVTSLPLVVLVGRATASSAEVVAAALHDHQRATIVGERTYGKALVQSIDPLGDGGALELTVAHYYTASGADISGIGVVPDVRAVDRPRTPVDEALAVGLQLLARPTS
jgi:carboxyl-terminal processing protease